MPYIVLKSYNQVFEIMIYKIKSIKLEGLKWENTMLDISEMIIASLSKIWHLVPIVIAIVLFKKFINKKDKKCKINKNEENERNGLNLELRTVQKYEELGYKVEKAKENQGINLLCFKENKILLVCCKDISLSKSIMDEDIKIFYKNAMDYVKINDLPGNDLELRYVIPYSDVLHKSAIKILMDNSFNCKYVVL